MGAQTSVALPPDAFSEHPTDALVIGCGIIGASIAWRLAGRGLTVRCLDPEPGGGATFAAAGMLAAVAESTFGEHDLMRLNVESAGLWPGFAAELESETGHPTGYRRTGTLTAAFDSDDRRQLRRVLALQRQWGLNAVEIDATEARRMEPSLGPRVAGAVWAADDHEADPRAVHAALMAGLSRRDVELVPRRAVALLTEHTERVTGVLDDRGRPHRATTVILAAGWGSKAVASGRLLAATGDGPGDAAVLGPPGLDVPTRPVKGQVVRLDARHEPSFRLHHVLRGIVQSRPVYAVPRENGEIVVGATSEEQPDDRMITAGGLFALLRDARALIPGLDELPVIDTTARARPGSPDNVPLIGDSGVPGLLLATGHYRNGILLAPLTAAAVADRCLHGAFPDTVSPADPARFADTHRSMAAS
ncbi:glycine oxidase ThiO [Phytoactinopolyspora halotolerans]|uniref:glycine oxidase n=1 Tax=Phytoactinopolyspora halotolerans TaxID=1981512 RepID=A0A6L9S1C4_9ACTN|nr:glycine oxidase ThiO [Phytoactinopolyspora halotolerans]NED98985.1 glycine oxidase ThiO [Phytoactinopolyspora halotolerans]